MSEHCFVNTISNNFFDHYHYDWSSLNYEQINNLMNKYHFSNSQIVEYVEDISIRIKYEQQIINKIYDNNKTIIHPRFMNMDSNKPIFLSKPRLQRSVIVTSEHHELIKSLFFLSDVLLEKKSLRDAIQNMD